MKETAYLLNNNPIIEAFYMQLKTLEKGKIWFKYN